MYLIYPQFCGNRLCGFLSVTGQHNDLLNAGFFQFCHSCFGSGLYRIRNEQISFVCPFYCHMNDGTWLIRLCRRDAIHGHQFLITCRYRLTIHLGSHTFSTDLLYLTDTIGVNVLSVRFFQTAADGVIGIAFCQRCPSEQFLFASVYRTDLCHLKHTLCQCTGLVTHQIPGPRKGFQIVGAFHQNASGRCAADSPKET